MPHHGEGVGGGRGTYTYLVESDGTNATVYDQAGNIVHGPGTNDETEINWALTNLTVGRNRKETVVVVGDYETSNPIVIPGTCILDLPEAYIFLADGSDCDLLYTISDYIEILGGRLNGNGANQAAGEIIYIFDGTHIQIRRTYMTDAFRDAVRIEATGGVDYECMVLVEDCDIFDSVGGGVRTVDGERLTVRGCYFKDIGNQGVDASAQDLTVENNTFIDIGSEAIFNGSWFLKCTGNTVDYSDEAVSSTYCLNQGGHEGVISHNVFLHPEFDCIIVTSHTNTISNNFIGGAGRRGINISAEDHNIIDGNIINDNSYLNPNTFDHVYLHEASYNVISNNEIFGQIDGEFASRYCIRINDALCVGNILEGNTMTPSVSGILSDLGTDTRMEYCQFQFSEPVVGVIVVASPTGVEVNLDTERALAWGQLPSGIQEVQRIRIWAVALDAPLGGGGQMHLEITFNAGASNAAYNEAGKSWNLPNFDSEEADYVANDVIHWIIEDGDVGGELVNLIGQDSFEIFAIHEAGAAPDGATDAVFRVVEIQYV